MARKRCDRGKREPSPRHMAKIVILWLIISALRLKQVAYRTYLLTLLPTNFISVLWLRWNWIGAKEEIQWRVADVTQFVSNLLSPRPPTTTKRGREIHAMNVSPSTHESDNAAAQRTIRTETLDQAGASGSGAYITFVFSCTPMSRRKE
jgi:hypothetical protein